MCVFFISEAMGDKKTETYMPPKKEVFSIFFIFVLGSTTTTTTLPTTNNTTSCPLGYTRYPHVGSRCVLCPANMVGVGGGTCAECPENTTADKRRHTCELCWNGFYRKSGALVCTTGRGQMRWRKVYGNSENSTRKDWSEEGMGIRNRPVRKGGDREHVWVWSFLWSMAATTGVVHSILMGWLQNPLR